jgi:1,4-dihydroxy-2-naphthoyl-CoA hydrolase
MAASPTCPQARTGSPPSNHLGTARDGTIECHATVAHQGRTTQVWDAVVKSRESGKTLALFRCTQMILYPKAA